MRRSGRRRGPPKTPDLRSRGPCRLPRSPRQRPQSRPRARPSPAASRRRRSPRRHRLPYLRTTRSPCSAAMSPTPPSMPGWPGSSKELEKAENQLRERIAEVEAKRAEYEKWMALRDDFLKKAEASVVEIYSRMKPDAAATQIAGMADETAAAVLAKLSPRSSSAIFNEMETARAAHLADLLGGMRRVDDGKTESDEEADPHPAAPDADRLHRRSGGGADRSATVAGRQRPEDAGRSDPGDAPHAHARQLSLDLGRRHRSLSRSPCPAHRRRRDGDHLDAGQGQARQQDRSFARLADQVRAGLADGRRRMAGHRARPAPI